MVIFPVSKKLYYLLKILMILILLLMLEIMRLVFHLNQILKKLNTDFYIIDGEKAKSPVNTLKNILDTPHEFINHDPYVFVHTLDIDIPEILI